MFNKKLIQTLKNTINNLEEDLSEKKYKAIAMKKNYDEMVYKNQELEKNNLILLQNALENRQKIKDLENNIEFLYNNLSAQKKKLIPKN